MAKYAELLAESIKKATIIAAKIYVESIVKAAEENKCNVEQWPLTFEIGKVVPNNQRLLNSMVEILETEYGFVVFLQEPEYLAIDLPVQTIVAEEFQEEDKKELLVSAQEAIKLSDEGSDARTNNLFKLIDKKIREAAKSGERLAKIDTNDKVIGKDPKNIKRVYTKLKSCGYNCDEGLKKDADGKIKFDQPIDTIRVKW